MNILTFDIEEWFHFDVYSTIDKWDEYDARINMYLPKVLNELKKRNITATFFCLGWIARKYPQILKDISANGHEIGCHSDMHIFVNKMSEKAFELDLRIALDSIENVIGKKVISYRAPAFSININTLWAFEILAKNGIIYDSSIFPSTRSYGGFPSFGEGKPSLLVRNGINIKEFPMSTAKILGKNFVYSGGGYFRLFPFRIIKKIMSQSEYNITYLHMRDFDYRQHRFKYFTIERYFKSYYGLKGAYRKYEKIMNDFDWISVKEAGEIIDWNQVRKIDL